MHRFIRLALRLTLTVGGIATVPARAAESGAEIPGIAWPGGPLRSTAGGPVVDRVWRIELPQGRVALIRLDGASGSELGLYLFDETATSILSATPLKQSAKPGGTQRLTAVLPAGTYYVNVNGRNTDRAYAFTLTVSLIEDPTPAFVFAEIADGATRISDPETSIYIGASDSLSGVDAVRYRIDGGTWSEWRAPVANHPISFEATEGRHTVEAQARNGAGLISDPALDSVVLDLTAPTGTLLAPASNDVVYTARPTIRYRFSEALRPSSWSTNGLTLESLDGAVVGGSGTYSAATKTGRFTTAALTPGVEYVVQIGDATDLAGNPVRADLWTLTYLVPTSMSTPRRTLAVSGDSDASLSFRATGVPAGALLVVERLETTETGALRWEGVTTVAARGDGTLQRVAITPDRSARYAVRFPGSATHGTSRTSSIDVTLTPKLTRLGGSAVRNVTPGAAAVAEFRVDPSGITGGTLIRSRCTSTFSQCTVVERRPVEIDPSGFVSVTWIPTKGRWSWQLQLKANELHEAALSPRARFSVR
ncbi:MAG: Ig-like domain-containing protein [Candidatus Limnocylindrus sp.]